MIFQKLKELEKLKKLKTIVMAMEIFEKLKELQKLSLRLGVKDNTSAGGNIGGKTFVSNFYNFFNFSNS